MGLSAEVAPPAAAAAVARRRVPRIPATAREQDSASSTRPQPATPRKERFDQHYDVRVESAASHDFLAKVNPHRVPPGRPAGRRALTLLGITSCLGPGHRCVERITTIAGPSRAGATFLSATDQEQRASQSRGGRSASTSPSRSGRRPSSQGRRNRSPRSRSRPARSPAAGP